MTDKPKQDDDKEFYEGVAKAADFVNKRLRGTIAPGGLNSVEKDEDDKGKK
ncbi:hypothetical protein [Paenibacillus sp. J2TS4]|uniref:hypothetical protein n=1 Tax=Paenibacillus sp. J2TS4 TaxID=2807194 RepID=UPI001B11A119|nr:hypothetical protein [Paenibacillus sp. J2TS4]GIP35073.1 hypothetical protein J2TS4_42830 [Paenibacillus sp. J2TS4]